MRVRNSFSLIFVLVWVQAVAVASGPLIQFVSPGQSIQAAIDRAPEGGWVLVQPSIYQETADPGFVSRWGTEILHEWFTISRFYWHDPAADRFRQNARSAVGTRLHRQLAGAPG